MVRIGGGVFPDIKEKDYLAQGNYRVDDQAPPVRAQQVSPHCSNVVQSMLALVCGRGNDESCVQELHS